MLFNAFWKFLRLGNSAWDFFARGGRGGLVNFWSTNFLGFVGTPWDVFGF